MISTKLVRVSNPHTAFFAYTIFHSISYLSDENDYAMWDLGSVYPSVTIFWPLSRPLATQTDHKLTSSAAFYGFNCDRPTVHGQSRAMLCSLSTSAPGPALILQKWVTVYIRMLLHNPHYIQQNEDNACTDYDCYILHHSKHITQ